MGIVVDTATKKDPGFVEVGHPAGHVESPGDDSTLANQLAPTPPTPDLETAVLDSPTLSLMAQDVQPDPLTDEAPRAPSFDEAMARVATTDPEPPATPSSLPAAFRLENTVVSATRYLMRDKVPERQPDHDPMPGIRGTPFEAEWERFVDSGSPEEDAQIKARIAEEWNDRKVIEDAGWAGTGAMMLAAVLDPTLFIPVGGATAKAYRGGRAAAAGAEAAKVGGITGAVVAGQEALLHQTQETRTFEESAYAIGGSVLLGGLLGAGASGIASRRFVKLGDELDAFLKVPDDPKLDPFEGGAVNAIRANHSAGAAHVEAGKPIAELESTLGVGGAVAWIDPLSRSLNSILPSAREAAARLAEVPLGFTRNKLGHTTSPVGGAAETMKKRIGDAPLARAVKALDDAYGEYRFADKDTKFKALRASVSKALGRSQHMTYQEFNIEVGRAAARWDEHDNPFVKKAAKAVRELLTDPLAEAAVKHKLLDESIWKRNSPQQRALAAGAKMAADKSPGGIAKAKEVADKLGADIRRSLGLEPSRPVGDIGSARHKELRRLERMAEGIAKALGLDADHALNKITADALYRANPDIVAKLEEAYARALAGVTDADIEEVRTAFEFVKLMKGVKPEERLLSWVRKRGGVKDHQGEMLAALGGDRKAHPFVISKKGQELDDLALAAWEHGFISGDTRPTINDFLDLVREDASGKAVVRSGDSEAMAYYHKGQEAIKDLEKLGVSTKAKSADEAVQQFIEAKTATNTTGTKASPEAIAKLKAAFDEVLTHPSAAPVAMPAEFSREVAEEIWGDAGQSYVTRLWNQEKVAAQRPRLKQILTDYFANARNNAERMYARLADDGAASLSDLDGLRKFSNLSDEELEAIADGAINNILGGPHGRMSFDLPPSLSKPLKSRTLRIADDLVEDFLERDIRVIARQYANTMASDISITATMGDLELTDAIAKITDEADAMASKPKVTERELKKIRAAKDKAISDLQDMRDRIRGTYAIPEDISAFWPRAGRVVRQLNLVRMLGGMTPSAIPDIARPMMTHGVQSYFQDGVVPLIKNLRAVRLAGEEVKLAGTGLDMALDTRVMALNDILDHYGRLSKFERAVTGLQDKFGLISLMAPWNAFAKQWSGIIVMANIIRHSEAALNGTLSEAGLRRLAAANIDVKHAKVIAEQFAKHGKKVDGVYLANTLAWDVADANVRKAQDAFRGAIVRDVDRMIVTPGQDKALFASTQVGSVIMQFKSFGMASTQRTILAGLQERDAGVLSGAMMMIALGGLSDTFKRWTNGHDMPESNEEWIVNAIDRSGLTGVLMDVNHFSEMATGFGVRALIGKPLSRYASRNALDSVLGPTAGTFQDAMNAVRSISEASTGGEAMKESDLRTLRRLVPLQNVFYLAWLFRQMQNSAGDALGVKQERKR